MWLISQIECDIKGTLFHKVLRPRALIFESGVFEIQFPAFLV